MRAPCTSVPQKLLPPFRCLTVVVAVALTAAFAQSANAAFRIRTVSVHGTRYLLLQDVARYYGMAFHSGRGSIRLTSRYSDLRFTLDRRETQINGVPTDLLHAPCMRKEIPAVSELDFRLVLDPILRGRALPRSAIRTVVLDPGHGGKDTGAIGRYKKGSLEEKDLVLGVATRLAVRLRKAGYRVFLTRDSDKTTALAARPSVAKTKHADLFISLHANSAKGKKVQGAETFLLTPTGTSSTYSRRHNTRASTGNTFDRQNTRLAFEVQKNLVRATGCENRGIKHARFLVLRYAPCPAILVEMGFLTHSGELEKLRTATYRDRVAAGIAYGIIGYTRCVAPKKK